LSTFHRFHHKIALLVQARTGSTRLPGKVLRQVGGRPVLAWMLDRLKTVKNVDTLAVITSVLPQDDAVDELCRKEGVLCFRGSETDLLDRHYQAGLFYNADAVVKVPSDCPLIDPGIVEKVVAIYRSNEFDYVSNLHPASWPDGMDVEVMSMEALEQAWKEADKPFQREHCTPFIWDQPERFALCNVWYETGEDLSKSVRLTLDYSEDLVLIEALIERLNTKHGGGDYSVSRILDILEEEPRLKTINEQHVGKYWTDAHRHELQNL